ncbi:glucokinase [Phenylobacterium sp.]|uniref:glucokinase n=1 Tax=Phenylobacterium sp. TaxID=1871053 RepID=UPI002EDB4D95
MRSQWVGLVGDVGGTNARLALVDGQGHIRNPRTFPCKDYASLADIVAEYIETTAGKKRPPRAVLAVAGPVVDGEIEFTNLDWVVSEGDLLAHFEFEAVELINDFAAQALACPLLEGPDLRALGPALPRGSRECPMLALGAGTGFGVAGLARSERGDLPISTEGGHAGFAPADEVEVEILKRLAAKYGRVSIERILSGQGLYDLYTILAELQGQPAPLPDEAAVTTEGMVGDPLAAATIDRFGRILGSVAGDLALTFGARGGVFVSGGIAPRIAEKLATGAFRQRFEDKGRLSDYVHDIPTYLVLHPYPAIVGAARQLEQMERL